MFIKNESKYKAVNTLCSLNYKYVFLGNKIQFPFRKNDLNDHSGINLLLAWKIPQ